jgi:hypothetical protein
LIVPQLGVTLNGHEGHVPSAPLIEGNNRRHFVEERRFSGGRTALQRRVKRISNIALEPPPPARAVLWWKSGTSSPRQPYLEQGALAPATDNKKEPRTYPRLSTIFL